MHPVRSRYFTHALRRLTGAGTRAPSEGLRLRASYADQMLRMGGIRYARAFAAFAINRASLGSVLLIIALSAGCLFSRSPVSEERAIVLDEVVESWIMEIEDLRTLLVGVRDERSSFRSLKEVQNRVSMVRSIIGEAGDRTDEDDAYVQSKFGDRLEEPSISFDTERMRLSIDGSIGNDIH